LKLLSLLLSLALSLLLQLLKPLLQAWYWDSKPALVRRLMRLVLDRGMLDSLHPCGEKFEEVCYNVILHVILCVVDMVVV
jgi:hypothetical protein